MRMPPAYTFFLYFTFCERNADMLCFHSKLKEGDMKRGELLNFDEIICICDMSKPLIYLWILITFMGSWLYNRSASSDFLKSKQQTDQIKVWLIGRVYGHDCSGYSCLHRGLTNLLTVNFLTEQTVKNTKQRIALPTYCIQTAKLSSILILKCYYHKGFDCKSLTFSCT